MTYAFVPPFVLEGIAARGTDAQRAAAKRSLLIDEIRRARRELAPVTQPDMGDEPREIRDARHGQGDGPVVRAEDAPPVEDQAVNEAYDALGNIFRLLKDSYGRNSIDGRGGKLIALVHVGVGYDNAYADPSTMRMYVGDGHFFNPFTRDGTVMSHEMIHLLTALTANLVYRKQPGALSEHISDVLAVLAEQKAYGQDVLAATWLVGQLLVEGKINGRALRDLLNGGAYDDPVIGKDPTVTHMRNYVETEDDEGGVHMNSGIPNRAFALASLQIGGRAWESTGRIWYAALTGGRLSSSASFAEFASLTRTIAGEMFGMASQERQAIEAGWTAVGVESGQPIPAPQPAPEPSGSSCYREMLELLQDASILRHMRALRRQPAVQRFLKSLTRE